MKNNRRTIRRGDNPNRERLSSVTRSPRRLLDGVVQVAGQAVLVSFGGSHLGMAKQVGQYLLRRAVDSGERRPSMPQGIATYLFAVLVRFPPEFLANPTKPASDRVGRPRFASAVKKARNRRAWVAADRPTDSTIVPSGH
jgi:hypothetical protein